MGKREIVKKSLTAYHIVLTTYQQHRKTVTSVFKERFLNSYNLVGVSNPDLARCVIKMLKSNKKEDYVTVFLQTVGH